MKLRIKEAWIVAGLATMAAMFLGQSLAQAGAVSNSGIYINMANSTPVGDPIYEYYLQITVDASTVTPLIEGGYITISGFTDLNVNDAGAGEPSDWASSLNLATGTVKFTYTPPDPTTTITDTQVYALGAFRVGPTIELGSAPTPTLTYTAYLNGSPPPSNSGTIVVTAGVVPEPSSAVLLLVGGGAFMLFWLHDKRRRGSRVKEAMAA